jgi:uncharacterized protein YdiU (UPF0061 family)
MKLNELYTSNDYFEFDEQFYEQRNAQPLNGPFLISYSENACELIGLDHKECETQEFIEILNGQRQLKNSTPFAMVYAGHQFGYFVPQLGDGRTINLGSINNWHLQTKGSGLTRYSRQGDGRAVLRSSIREFIISEAMHALHIPTTRALAIIGSNHEVYRHYGEVEKGAIVLRLSTSWIRFGTFEFFAKHNKNHVHLKQLADYVINQSYPHLNKDEHKYEKMFYEVVDNTAILLAKWQAYGFMHGVMNTDNMSIEGLTLDYGPFAFMDYFDIHNICNHTDEEGRYSYSSQPYIAKWNLSVLANALKSLCDIEKLNAYLETYFSFHEKHYLDLMSQRLGLNAFESGDNNAALVVNLLDTLQDVKVDYNYFFYCLTQAKNVEEIESVANICIYPQKMKKWLTLYKKLRMNEAQDFKEQRALMKTVNPKYVIKNYMLQEAIEKAQEGDFSLVDSLLHIAQNPFDEHVDFERYACSTPQEHSNVRLSCSS